MKHFTKVHSKHRKNQEERGQYAVMKKNQRKAVRRQQHITDSDYKFWMDRMEGFN